MDKEKVIFMLNSMLREITCMNQEIFDKQVGDNSCEMKFCHYLFSEPAKIDITLSMKKTEITKE